MSSTTDATSGVSTWAKDSVQPVQEAPSIQMTGYRLPDVAPITDSSRACATRGTASWESPAAAAMPAHSFMKLRRVTPREARMLSKSDIVA